MKVAGVESLFLNYIAPVFLDFYLFLSHTPPTPQSCQPKKQSRGIGEKKKKKKIIALYF